MAAVGMVVLEALEVVAAGVAVGTVLVGIVAVVTIV